MNFIKDFYLNLTPEIGYQLATVVLLGSALFFLKRKTLETRDFLTISKALESFLNRKPRPPRMKLNSKESIRLWNLINPLLESKRSNEATLKDKETLANDGSEILLNAKTPEELAHYTLNLINKHCFSLIKSAAIFSSNKTCLASIGFPIKRLEQGILAAIDDIEGGFKSIGYHSSLDGEVFDFRKLEIGMTFFYPLDLDKSKSSWLWLGLENKSALSLGAKEKNYIQSICKYANAALVNAQKTKEEKDKTKNERDLLLGVSHDIRAPGNAALYALRDFLAGSLGKLNDDQLYRLSIIERCLEDQLDIVSDVLNYTQHQQGNLEPKKQQLVLEDSIKKTIESFSIHAESKGLEFEIGAIPSVIIEFDPTHIKRILANFISNAINYTRNGKVLVNFILQSNLLKIQVSDSGGGIDEKNLDKLFKQFSRLDTDSTDGFGLGLSLAKALAEANDAKVFYENFVDEETNRLTGSTFGIEIENVKLGTTLEEEFRFLFNNCLIIDDDPFVCKTNARYLKDLVKNIEVRNTIESATDEVLENSYDLIVSDYQIGNENTSQLLLLIRSKNPTAKIVILSGALNDNKLASIVDSIDARTIEKPCSRTQLRQNILDDLYSKPIKNPSLAESNNLAQTT